MEWLFNCDVIYFNSVAIKIPSLPYKGQSVCSNYTNETWGYPLGKLTMSAFSAVWMKKEGNRSSLNRIKEAILVPMD